MGTPRRGWKMWFTHPETLIQPPGGKAHTHVEKRTHTHTNTAEHFLLLHVTSTCVKKSFICVWLPLGSSALLNTCTRTHTHTRAVSTCYPFTLCGPPLSRHSHKHKLWLCLATCKMQMNCIIAGHLIKMPVSMYLLFKWIHECGETLVHLEPPLSNLYRAKHSETLFYLSGEGKSIMDAARGEQEPT